MIKYLITDPKYYTNDEKKFEEILINVLDKQQIEIACFRDKESSNFEELAKVFIKICKEKNIKEILLNGNYLLAYELNATGVHLTSTQFDEIKKAKDLGAQIVVVHGETLNEPVIEGTNYAAVNSEYVDILGHPGLITYEEAQIAKENGIYLEISARSGHCLGNGHVANIASEVGNKLLVNTDTHSPDNLITFEKSYEIALGAGLSKKEAMAAIVDNPRELLKSKGIL